jgi:hypothetical protein
MPNWCYNTLCVSGNKEQLADFVSKTIIPQNMSSEGEYNESHRFTFNILHPTPKALEADFAPLPKLGNETDEEYKARLAENVRLYGAEDWYRWHIDNWGTKWDCSSTYVDELNDTNLNVHFNTAWSPPVEWLEKVIPMYPKLDFDLIFDEEGESFCGKLTGRNGEVVLLIGEPYYTDEQDRLVIYDSNKHLWRYDDTKELIEDEDFCPINVNPYF